MVSERPFFPRVLSLVKTPREVAEEASRLRPVFSGGRFWQSSHRGDALHECRPVYRTSQKAPEDGRDRKCHSGRSDQRTVDYGERREKPTGERDDSAPAEEHEDRQCRQARQAREPEAKHESQPPRASARPARNERQEAGDLQIT